MGGDRRGRVVRAVAEGVGAAAAGRVAQRCKAVTQPLRAPVPSLTSHLAALGARSPQLTLLTVKLVSVAFGAGDTFFLAPPFKLTLSCSPRAVARSSGDDTVPAVLYVAVSAAGGAMVCDEWVDESRRK